MKTAAAIIICLINWFGDMFLVIAAAGCFYQGKEITAILFLILDQLCRIRQKIMAGRKEDHGRPTHQQRR